VTVRSADITSRLDCTYHVSSNRLAGSVCKKPIYTTGFTLRQWMS
jgi:hypothetical protein